MATPASGSISMLDMRSEITRGTGAISMSEVRTRYGGSGSISFSNLYAAEGFVVTNGSYTSKFVSYNGWAPSTFTGSVSPAESNGRILIVSTSFVSQIITDIANPTTRASITISSDNVGNQNLPAAGWRGTDLIRIVAANTARTINSSANNFAYFTFTVPSSGLTHYLVQF